MKFRFVREVEKGVPSYGGAVVKTGDVIELDGHLSRKAAANPDYQLVAEEDGDDTPKRRGRPPKVKDGDES